MHGVICAGVILSVMGAAFFFYVLCAPHPWPVCLVCAGTDWLVPKSPVAFHTLGLGLLPVCITPSTPPHPLDPSRRVSACWMVFFEALESQNPPVLPLAPTSSALKLLSSKHLAQVSPPSLLPELVPALASFLAL